MSRSAPHTTGDARYAVRAGGVSYSSDVPTYEYVCRSCGHELEAVQSIHDAALTECPECGGSLRKLFGNVGVHFKGSGFYRTDSRSSKGKGASKSGAGSGATKDADSGGASASGKGSGEKGSDKSSNSSSSGGDSKAAPSGGSTKAANS